MRLSIVVFALVVTAFALPAAAVEPVEWAIVGGVANVLDGDQATGLGGVETRWHDFRLPIGGRQVSVEPALGLTVNGDGGTYAYLSFRVDLFAGIATLAGDRAADAEASSRPWRLVGFTGLGHYRRGSEGRELGGPLEFRSGLELAYRVSPRSRLGLSFDHLSNADIYDRNPGSESLVLVWSWQPRH